MLKIWKCFAHSTKCFIFCPSATFGHATPIVQCTAATLVPLLIHCTQALMVPSDHSISPPLLSVPLVLPETSKVSFFCLCVCCMLCNIPLHLHLHLQSCHFNLLISGGRIVTLLAMPPAWVDFSWAMVRGKRDNVKQISFVVIMQHG
jgi:hypothetical protein